MDKCELCGETITIYNIEEITVDGVKITVCAPCKKKYN